MEMTGRHAIIRAQDDFLIGEEGPRSQTSVVYEVVRSAILSGQLEPERKLKIQELAGELEVSVGAVREALSRLIPERLVVSREQRGFFVAPLSLTDLVDLTELRCEIEGIALRRSVELGDVEWEAGILAAEHRLKRGHDKLDDKEAKRLWTRNHAAFHTALISACGSSRLLELHAQLYEQSERYRGLLTFHFPGTRKVDDEHRKIVEFALARDSDRLVEAMVDHLRATTTQIVQAFRHSGGSPEALADLEGVTAMVGLQG